VVRLAIASVAVVGRPVRALLLLLLLGSIIDPAHRRCTA
jgi:hypothetical protein